MIDESVIATLFEVEDDFFEGEFEQLRFGKFEDGEGKIEEIVDAFDEKDVPDARSDSELEGVGKDGGEPFCSIHDRLHA